MSQAGNDHGPAEILLVRPRDTSMPAYKKIGATQHPMNLVYLATWLSSQGHKPEIIDLEVEPLTRLKERLGNSPPFLVGITAMTPNIPEVKDLIGICRSFGVKTVVGGVHATIMPAETLNDTGCDYVVVGDGEKPLEALLAAVKAKRAPEGADALGIGFLQNGAPVIHERRPLIDIDTLPVPDRRFLKLDLYSGEVSPGITGNAGILFTSLGCPFQCAFCASKVVNQQRMRYRGLEKVFAEVDDMVSLGFDHIYVEDETFGLTGDRLSSFCRYLIQHHPKLSWNCQMRIGTVHENTLKLMKESRCRKISFGVESGSPRILKAIHKDIDADRVREDFKLVKKFKIPTQAFFMIGFPDETMQDIELTEKLIREIRPDFLFLSACTPYPGTRIYDVMKQSGYLASLDWGKFVFFGSSIPWRTDFFSGEDIVRMRNAITRRYYLSVRYSIDRLLSVRSFSDFRYLVRAGAGMLKAVF